MIGLNDRKVLIDRIRICPNAYCSHVSTYNTSSKEGISVKMPRTEFSNVHSLLCVRLCIAPGGKGRRVGEPVLLGCQTMCIVDR